MSKLLPIPRIACAVALCSQLALPLFAQSRPKQPVGRVRLGGPKKQAVQVPDAQLKAVLVDWYEHTRKIKFLGGAHKKYVYDFTFNVEKRGIGKFYYEAPDKGRIDIEPAKIGDDVSRRVGKRNKKPFTLQAARADIWLSDGKEILQIDKANKRARRYAIPPTSQGQNIMDGPLPFLLGMPPNKALARYKLKVLRNTKAEVWLQVEPRWRRDAANYKEAKVILKKDNHYLPSAVKLTDPTGHEETVYTFFEFDVNRRNLVNRWFGKDWKKFDLTAYKVEDYSPKRRAAKPPTMPNLRGENYYTAKKQLEAMKLEIVVCSAALARKTENVNRIISQLPAANSPVRKGQKVFVSILADPKKFDAANQKVIPRLAGAPYKTATAALEKLGYKVELRKGNVAKNPASVYKVEHQYPPAGQPALKGSKIVLWLFVAATDRKRQAKTVPAKTRR